MVILVNAQLEMTCGKLAAQVAHAACYCLDILKRQVDINRRKMLDNPYRTDEEDSEYFGEDLQRYSKLEKGWNDNGTKKIVLRVDTELELLRYLPEGDIGKKMIDDNIMICPVEDLGLTQIPRNSLTCLGIGPDLASKIDKYTGEDKLKLL